jgi:site-specific DNA recombinase
MRLTLPVSRFAFLERSESRQPLFCNSDTNRNAFQSMIDLARRDLLQVDGIVFWSLSRFARRLLDARFHKAELRKRGFELIWLSGDIPEGDFAPIIEVLIDWKNERFLRDLAEDVKRSLHSLARQGYAPGGFPPVGYLAEKVVLGRKRNGELRTVSRWIIDPDAWGRVKQAWHMRAEGASIKEIHEATHLYRSKSCYSTFFSNTTYLGMRKCGEEQTPNAHPAAVDQETWDKVQSLRQTHIAAQTRYLDSDQNHPRRHGSSYLLSGLVYCGRCGAAMQGGTDNRNGHRPTEWPFYVCGRKANQNWEACPTGKVDAQTVEFATWRAVTEKALTTDFLEALTELVNTQLADTQELDAAIEHVSKQSAELNRAIESLLNLAEKAGSEAAAARLIKREAEYANLQAELRSLESRRQASGVSIDKDTLTDILLDLRGQRLGITNVKVQRALLRHFVSRVEIEPGRIRVWYAFPLQEA